MVPVPLMMVVLKESDDRGASMTSGRQCLSLTPDTKVGGSPGREIMFMKRSWGSRNVPGDSGDCPVAQ